MKKSRRITKAAAALRHAEVQAVAKIPKQQQIKTTPQIAEDEITPEFIGFFIETEFEQFCSYLETARAIYRKHPDLITSSKIPEPYAAKFRKVLGRMPYTDHLSATTSPADVFSSRFAGTAARDAREQAKIWLNQKRPRKRASRMEHNHPTAPAR
jgi:hypothetical protein